MTTVFAAILISIVIFSFAVVFKYGKKTEKMEALARLAREKKREEEYAKALRNSISSISSHDVDERLRNIKRVTRKRVRR